MKNNLVQGSGNPVVFFDIGCQDSTSLQAFYTQAFGWQMSLAQHHVKINTGSSFGIQGSMTSLGHEPYHYIMFYIEVSSVTDAIDDVVKLGGAHHIGPLPTGAGQYFAWVKDPEGNQIGIISTNE